jgi:hypothetical protein
MMRYTSDRYLTGAMSGLLITTLILLGAMSVWHLKGDKPVADLALRVTLP